MALVHLVRPKRTEKESTAPATVGGGDRDKYDYEHRIRLDDEQIKKLKVPDAMTRGRVVIHAHGFINDHGVTETHGEGKKRRMGIQITHLELKPHPGDAREANKAEHLDEVAGGKTFGKGGE